MGPALARANRNVNLMMMNLLLSLSLAATTFALSAPPRGWNSYDSYNWHVNETQFSLQLQGHVRASL